MLPQATPLGVHLCILRHCKEWNRLCGKWCSTDSRWKWRIQPGYVRCTRRRTGVTRKWWRCSWITVQICTGRRMRVSPHSIWQPGVGTRARRSFSSASGQIRMSQQQTACRPCTLPSRKGTLKWWICCWQRVGTSVHALGRASHLFILLQRKVLLRSFCGCEKQAQTSMCRLSTALPRCILPSWKVSMTSLGFLFRWGQTQMCAMWTVNPR
mmetsp:Transcript_18026/g.45432  ORF Transcript_18026/g.45432 Transcript_18026/m.45432 type:complete len:211 (+) Transcript_18026:607-1239(+)